MAQAGFAARATVTCISYGRGEAVAKLLVLHKPPRIKIAVYGNGSS